MGPQFRIFKMQELRMQFFKACRMYTGLGRRKNNKQKDCLGMLTCKLEVVVEHWMVAPHFVCSPIEARHREEVALGEH